MLIAAASFEIIPTPDFAAWMTLPFLATMISLHVLLFKPYLAYLEARESASDGARAEASRLAAEADAALVTLEARIAEAKAGAVAARASRRDAAIAQEAEILGAARGEANATLDAALAELSGEVDTARGEVRTLAAALSRDLAGQVLGRGVAA